MTPPGLVLAGEPRVLVQGVDRVVEVGAQLRVKDNTTAADLLQPRPSTPWHRQHWHPVGVELPVVR